MKRNILNSPRLLELKKHRRKVFVSKILLIFFALALIVAGAAYASRMPVFNIKQVKIIGKAAETEAIKAMVQDKISGNYLWLFPKTNVLFYPKRKIEDKLLEKFKRIGGIKFSVKNEPFPNEKILEVFLSEREGKYLWCGGEAALSPEKTQCYFMDGTGFIFEEAPYFSGEIYFKFYGPGRAGGYFSEGNFKQLIDFKDVLSTGGIKPVSLYISESGEGKVFLVSPGAAARPYIAFKSSANFPKLVKNLETALNTEPLLSNFKNKYSSLEYIDLRFGNKVYYKFK